MSLVLAARVAQRTDGLVTVILSTGASLGVGLLLVLHQAYAAEFAAAGLVVALLFRIDLRYAVAALLAYLPFEGLVLKYVPSGHVAAARYTPEILIVAIVLVIVLSRFDLVLARLREGVLPFALLFVVWISSGVWNSLGPGTELIGLRSELRFVPLLVILLVSATPTRDARLYARVLVWLGAIESLIAGIEFVSGPSIRSWFAPHWNIVLGGVSVSNSGPPDLGSVFGTFSHYNALGIFLLFAWTLLAAAGAENLGFSRRFGLAVGWMMVVAIAVSGSRESAIALVISAIIIGRIRRRLPTLIVSAMILITAALLVPAFISKSNIPTAAQSSSSLPVRWTSLLSPAAWRADQYSNFRLFLLKSNAEFVAKTSPGLGYGIGSVADRSKLADGTSPIYRTFAGFQAASFSYVYDGNWGLLILEVGFLGVAVLGLLFAYLIWVGASLLQMHWSGLALITTVSATVVLGFFAPILQLRAPGAIIWLLTGIALACRAELIEGRVTEPETILPRPQLVSP